MAANEIWGVGLWIWCIVIGALIALWISIGVQNLGKLNLVAMLALLILTIVLGYVIFGGNALPAAVGEGMSFGAAVELSVAMPLSWLPVISDYTREAEKPVGATAVSVLVYGVVSSFMYVIGMGAALFTGESDVALIMAKAGLGVVGLGVVVLSTVTTTFLDAWSAGISSEAIQKKWSGKHVALLATVIGVLGAIFLPLSDITDFLYFIGSVFAPMIAIQITDFLILKNNRDEKTFDAVNLVVWLIGFIAYRYLMTLDIPIGNTLPDMLFTAVLCILVNKGRQRL